MGNFFKELVTRYKNDWQDWRAYKVSMRNVRLESKAIARAMNRAREKNSSNGRTYYILRDKFGGINEFNRDDIIFWSLKHKPALIDNMSYLERINAALGIVTSNKHIQAQYDQVQLKKEEASQ